MTRAVRVLLALTLGVSVACGGGTEGPPTIEVDRTACAHCGMLVSEPIFAAAYRTPDGDARVFDDIGCLIASAREETETGGRTLTVWFRDADDGGWVPGADAVFVRSPDLQTPMNGGLMAYRDPAVARQAAQELRGEVVPSLAELLSDTASRRKEGGL